MTIASMGGLEDPDPNPEPMRRIPKLTRGQVALVVLGVTFRLAAGFAFILLIMWLVPEQPDATLAYPALVAIIGGGVYVWFFRRQVKGVYRARYPTLRAIEALILVAAMFLAIFAILYVMISQANAGSFTEELTPFSAYYYALVVLATVGFGDITPVTTPARSVTMLQMALDIAFIAVIIKLMSTAARRALQTRMQSAGEQAGPR